MEKLVIVGNGGGEGAACADANICFASTGVNAPETVLASLKFKLFGWRADRFWPRPLFSVFRCLDQPVPCTFFSLKVSRSRGSTPLTLLRRSSKLDLNIVSKGIGGTSMRPLRSCHRTEKLEIYCIRGRENLHLLLGFSLC
jgi:hypothetical protein